jgi:hypothetical protein
MKALEHGSSPGVKILVRKPDAGLNSIPFRAARGETPDKAFCGLL